MTTKCILHTQTGLCVNIIDDPTDTFIPPDGYSVAPDNTGTFYWFWDGDNWVNPYEKYFNSYLGFASAETVDVSDESNAVATTFYVAQKIQDYINNTLLQNITLDGGAFDDPATIALTDAGYFNDTGGNLSADLQSPLFDDTGGNLSTNVDGGSF